MNFTNECHSDLQFLAYLSDCLLYAIEFKEYQGVGLPVSKDDCDDHRDCHLTFTFLSNYLIIIIDK